MNYTIQASQRTPALIIYLIDISASMNMLMDGKRRIDIVYEALSLAIRQMVFRSTKGNRLTPGTAWLYWPTATMYTIC